MTYSVCYLFYFWTVNYLDMCITDFKYTETACFPQQIFIDFSHVLHIHTETCKTVVYSNDIVKSAKTFDDSFSCLLHFFTDSSCRGRFPIIFISYVDGDLLLSQIRFEDHVVDYRICDTDYDYPDPVGTRLEDTPDEEVDDTAACVTDRYTKCCHESEGDTAHQRMETEQCRSNEHEGELKRFCDTGNEACCDAGDHQSFDSVFLIRRRCLVNRQSSSG